MIDGFLLVDKPGGWTSHDVVAKARILLGQRRVGHAGTLDPMATGLLVLGLGRATRLIRFVQDTVKVYEATALFGVATDTLDADGAILSREEMDIDEADVHRAAKRFVGRVMQVPPMVSAKKVGGRRLHELARQGIEVEREAVPVDIHEIEVLDVAPGPYPEVQFRVHCGAGTYVRTLADDIAAALGGRAHLTALRRTAIGALDVATAHTIEALEEAAASSHLMGLVLPPSQGLTDLPAVEVDRETGRAVGHGSVFPVGALGIEQPGSHRIIDQAGKLLAVYRSDGRRATPEVVLA
ncbi:MAG TPA: tRNA pseudouridine(55) synthase TruB [Acidimicrobiia bacterium]|nr:tRNA pseudouridine(55) synthase TruB [Acidimicrobiia bacterium]